MVHIVTEKPTTDDDDNGYVENPNEFSINASNDTVFDFD